MGMLLPNFLNGQTIGQNDLNNEFVQLIHSTHFLDDLVPCVYYGFNVINQTGLNITINNGYGRASDVLISYVSSGILQIECTTSTISTTLTLPANSIVYIVVNSNISSLSSGLYNYTTTDTINYTTTLTSTFPTGTLIGQIPLYTVTTNSTAIDSISTNSNFLNFNQKFSRNAIDLDNVIGGISALGLGELLPDNYYTITGKVSIVANGGFSSATYNITGHAFTTTSVIQATMNTQSIPTTGVLLGAYMVNLNQFIITSTASVTGTNPLLVNITISGY